MATVYPQIRPSHERARIAKKENCSTTVFLWLGQAAQHILRRPCFPSLRVLLEKLLHHSRHNITWRDCVDANFVLTPF